MKQNRLIVGLFFVLIIVMLNGCSDSNPVDSADQGPELVTVEDMAGREVAIPSSIDKVYATSATGSVMLYTLAPEKLAGWNTTLREHEKKYINPIYYNLPDLGRWKGSSPTGSIEDLLKTGPDVIISVGDVSVQYVSDAESIEDQTGIPVLMVDGSLSGTAKAYRFVGDLLDESDRAEELAIYCEKTFNEIDRCLKEIPEGDRVKVYYAEGIEGLETDVKGTVNSEAIDLAGAINVADPGTGDAARRIQVSMEQLMVWDPEVIIVSVDADTTHEVYNKMLNGETWKNIQAVQDGQVYEIPCEPYDWINRPPSIVRLIGVQWLTNILYPDASSIDFTQEVAEFFNVFFDYELSEEAVNQILERSQHI
ncbi:MAG: ABC transporter substrate-binding protein [Bacillota bacterium]|nr:ABC transporter substrate-binding protein [Bacillota bacterium]